MTITYESLEATLRNIITPKTGEPVVTFSDTCLIQVNRLVEAMVDVSGYKKEELTQSDLESIDEQIGLFYIEQVVGTVVDGVVQPDDEPQMAEMLARIKDKNSEQPLKKDVVAMIVMTIKLLNEIKQVNHDEKGVMK
jgi:hypothetical protein